MSHCVYDVHGFKAFLAVQIISYFQNFSYRFIPTSVVDNEKNAHLRSLENASENLRLFKAELLDYDALFAAIEGCLGVFHVASPILPDTIPNPEAR